MDKDKNQTNIVDSHRNMLMVSKNLSDFQIQNMKHIPILCDSLIQTIELTLTPSNKSCFTLSRSPSLAALISSFPLAFKAPRQSPAAKEFVIRAFNI